MSVPFSSNPPRFLADENVERAIVDGARRIRPQMIFKTVAEVGIAGLPDPLVLERAQELDLILVSHDRRTMYRFFAEFLVTLPAGAHCPGVFLVSQERYSIGEIIGFIVEIYDLSGHQEWRDQITVLPL